ncbi:hypothetical protein [Diaminobutyricibacter sp. McL0608]|uniref:hypothetical protein n=1 Tax=Leifsonia sp. McL0608 TaxID=3143537 RepID=UPI0031F3077C
MGNLRPTVGVALSGGGVRAASFGLGAVEELHAQRGILRGEKSADWISAVSGGSYIAGTITLLNAGNRATYADGTNAGGTDLPEGASPVSESAIRYLLAHSRYLIDQGGWLVVLRIVVLFAAGLVTLAVLTSWVATMTIGDLGFLGAWARRLSGFAPEWLESSPLAQWAVGILGVVGLIASLRIARMRPPKESSRTVRTLLGIGILALSLLAISVTFLAIPSLTDRLDATPFLSSPQWLIENGIPIIVAVGAILLFAILLNLLAVPLVFVRVPARIVSFIVARSIPWVIGVALISWVGLWVFHLLIQGTDETADIATSITAFIVFFGVLLAAVIVSPVPGLISPHRPYRALIARCFAVRRNAAGEVEAMPRADEVALSSLLPEGSPVRFPELIICAAANVTDVGSSAAGSNVLPLMLGGSTVSIPTKPGAIISTRNLEQMRSPRPGYGIVAPRPMLGLSSAIAIAGAAVSPAMGRTTMPSLRPLLTAFNIRLGVWLPNPLSEDARAKVEAHQEKHFGVGIDQLVWELFGRHSVKYPLIYASDGGHFENLGIFELLRRQCAVVWAVDASADPRGLCAALAKAIRLAHSELDCHVDFNLDEFAERDSKGRPTSVFASGSVRYADGSTGIIHVVRLGVTAKHSSALKQYQLEDRAFPYHSTIYQVFKWERFDSYRLLGQETMGMLLASLPSDSEEAMEII